MASKVIFLVTLGVLAASAAVLEHDADEGPLSNTCLKCIHEVLGAEGCSLGYCGPFGLTVTQWQTAYNLRGTPDNNAYTTCTTNYWCAARTVQEYMSKTLPLCVRRTPNGDSFRSVCESAYILLTGIETDCQALADGAVIREKRDNLLTCLGRRTEEWLNEGKPEDTEETTTPVAFYLAEDNMLAESELTKNYQQDSIQEKKLDVNVLEILNAV